MGAVVMDAEICSNRVAWIMDGKRVRDQREQRNGVESDFGKTEMKDVVW